ncbi:leucine-rich repeat domain-containing protein [Treponema sp. R80B11-R83G3]
MKNKWVTIILIAIIGCIALSCDNGTTTTRIEKTATLDGIWYGGMYGNEIIIFNNDGSFEIPNVRKGIYTVSDSLIIMQYTHYWNYDDYDWVEKKYTEWVAYSISGVKLTFTYNDNSRIFTYTYTKYSSIGTSGDFSYVIGDVAVITGYNGTGVAVTIPTQINGKPVTGIGGYAFYPCDSLASVTIPNSVKSIGRSAFYDCTSLTGITIPDSVKSIGDWAFENCTSLTSITIPSSVTGIGYGAFMSCTSLTSVTIGNGVTSFGDWVFHDCTSLTSVTLVSGIKTIGKGAFNRCTRLASITIPNSVIGIRDGAFQYCSSLTSVTIPNNVKSIGNWVFYDCTSLTSVTIPNSVTSIGLGAFDGCSSLTAINVAAQNTAYSSVDGVLYNKNKTTLVKYPGGRTGAFTIPNSVTVIGENAFTSSNNLTGVTIPNSVTSIIDDAFRDCTNLVSVTIPNSVTSIGERAFADCTSLTSVTFATGSNITDANFGDSAFPEGWDGLGGDNLKTTYSRRGKAGTYMRSEYDNMWTKMPDDYDDDDVPKTMIITGIPATVGGVTLNGKQITVDIVDNSNNRIDMVAVGQVNITSTTVTIPLISVTTMRPFTGTGSYYIIFYLDVNNTQDDFNDDVIYAYTEDGSTTLIKYNLTVATTTIPFNLFNPVAELILYAE